MPTAESESTQANFALPKFLYQEEVLMNQVKLGIIGLGNMGSGHCNNILAGLTPELKLTAAADLRQSRRDWAKETLPDDVVLFENGDQLIESGLCDAVIIATPHYEHPRLAILAFEHGLHVMSEKPAGVYTKQVREMNEAAIRSGKVFGMMFNQRTNCVYRKMFASLVRIVAQFLSGCQAPVPKFLESPLRRSIHQRIEDEAVSVIL